MLVNGKHKSVVCTVSDGKCEKGLKKVSGVVSSVKCCEVVSPFM